MSGPEPRSVAVAQTVANPPASVRVAMVARVSERGVRVAAADLLRASGAEVTVDAVEDVQGDRAACPTFVFGAMSPYSWLAAERVESLLGPVRWWPVFAGGLFKARGDPRGG